MPDLEWFIYVERKEDGRKAIVAGPYDSAEAACDRKNAVVDAAIARTKEGGRLWWETWGHCSAPIGTLKSRMGVI